MPAIELNSTPLISDANLVSYKRFEGNSTDAINTAYNGTDTSITYGAGTGMFGQGAAFGGSSKIVLGTALTMPSDVTIAAWIKNNNTGDQVIFGDCNATGSIDWYFKSSGKKLFLEWASAVNNYVDYQTTSDVIPDTNWHLVIVTVSGVSAPIFYVDGSSVASSLVGSAGSNARPSSGQGSAFGTLGAYTGGLWKFNGTMDDPAIFSRILTSTEISNLYNGTWSTTFPRSASVSVSNAAVGWTIH